MSKQEKKRLKDLCRELRKTVELDFEKAGGSINVDGYLEILLHKWKEYRRTQLEEHSIGFSLEAPNDLSDMLLDICSIALQAVTRIDDLRDEFYTDEITRLQKEAGEKFMRIVEAGTNPVFKNWLDGVTASAGLRPGFAKGGPMFAAGVTRTQIYPKPAEEPGGDWLKQMERLAEMLKEHSLDYQLSLKRNHTNSPDGFYLTPPPFPGDTSGFIGSSFEYAQAAIEALAYKAKKEELPDDDDRIRLEATELEQIALNEYGYRLLILYREKKQGKKKPGYLIAGLYEAPEYDRENGRLKDMFLGSTFGEAKATLKVALLPKPAERLPFENEGGYYVPSAQELSFALGMCKQLTNEFASIGYLVELRFIHSVNEESNEEHNMRGFYIASVMGIDLNKSSRVNKGAYLGRSYQDAYKFLQAVKEEDARNNEAQALTASFKNYGYHLQYVAYDDLARCFVAYCPTLPMAGAKSISGNIGSTYKEAQERIDKFAK